MNKLLSSIFLFFCFYCSSSIILAETPITVSGAILDNVNKPLFNVAVKVNEQVTTTDQLGSFQLTITERNNSILEISHPGFRDEVIPLHLLKNDLVKQYPLDPVIMSPLNPSQTRFVFGGDTSFGRRYIDPAEITPRDQVPLDDFEALILVSDPVPGSRNVAKFIRPIFQNADWSVLNLETPLTRDPSTPHEEKGFVFFTLPESAQALTFLGVDYVSLGNNHLYDYLDIGVQDTIQTLNDVGVASSGAGLNSEKAFLPFQKQLNASIYSFLSVTSVSGSQHQITYVADETKGGAADARDQDSIAAAIQLELDKENIPIMQMHGGREYTFEPSEHFFEQLQFAVSAGAKLVIGHHPHVAQGVGLIDDTVTIHSLGNLIFDQARLETMLGLVARIDMDKDKVEDLRFYPVYIGDFIPKPLAGDLANIFLRRIGEFSLAYDGLVYPYNNQGWVVLADDSAVQVDRSILIDVTIPASGQTVVDLRQIAESHESLSNITSANTAVNIQIGRDLLNHGDFEDWDIDDQGLAAARWNTSGSSSEVCSFAPFRGKAALCSSRSSENISDSVISFRNRTRVMGDATGEPNKDLSLLGYAQGLNAGPIKIITRFFASSGSVEFGEEETISHQGGTFSWQPLFANINMPAESTPDLEDRENNPRAVRIFIRHSPTFLGEGVASFDDFAIINWEETLSLSALSNIAIPHARDFLRVTGAPGTYQITLKFSHYQPKSSRFIAPLLQVNGADDLVIDEQSNVQVNLKLQQHLQQNPVVDWWVYATTDTGQFFSYVYPQGWQVGESRTVASPQLTIDSFDLYDGKLPAGQYTVNFCIDDNLDNIKDCTWKDSANIQVNN